MSLAEELWEAARAGNEECEDELNRLLKIEKAAQDHLAREGICASADDDGESLVCGSDQCTYCALVEAVDGNTRKT